MPLILRPRSADRNTPQRVGKVRPPNDDGRHTVPTVVRFVSCSVWCYHAKWAKALLASAMRWVFSRVVMALPSFL